MACAHAPVERSGERVCTRCGLVLDSHLFEEEPGVPAVAGREWAWRRALKAFLRGVGRSDVAAGSFPPPPRAGNLSYRVLAAYAYWLRFAAEVPSSFARTAGQATPREWRRAARAYQAAAAEDDAPEAVVRRLCRRHGLARSLAGAACRALEEPRLETCEPLHVLVACTAESLGDELAARIFAAPAATVRRYRERHRVQAFAVSLEAEGLALRAHVERCEHYTGAAPLQSHVRRCPSCCRRAEELELSFLLRTDVG
jgi:transcription initiation factor TFIIIB Brf1 subunit/transcription initiation factor TFIIB